MVRATRREHTNVHSGRASDPVLTDPPSFLEPRLPDS